MVPEEATMVQEETMEDMLMAQIADTIRRQANHLNGPITLPIIP